MTGDRSDNNDQLSLGKTSTSDVQFPVNSRNVSVQIFNLSSLKSF